jgi:hypothetical protein
MYVFISDHACFRVREYLLYSSSMHERKHAALSSRAWLTSLNMMSSGCIHLPPNHMSLFLMAELFLFIYLFRLIQMGSLFRLMSEFNPLTFIVSFYAPCLCSASGSQSLQPKRHIESLGSVPETTQIEDPRVQWRREQEHMLKDYLVMAQEALSAQKEIYQVKQQRLELAQQEYQQLHAVWEHRLGSQVSCEYLPASASVPPTVASPSTSERLLRPKPPPQHSPSPGCHCTHHSTSHTR